MITFKLNDETIRYTNDLERNLLDFLRKDKGLTAVKDGCSGQSACGACTVEINGKARLSCVIKMGTLQDAQVYTPEGFPEYVLHTIANALVNEGAVQCGFCTPGFISRTKILLQNNPAPSIEEIRSALKQHLCRCTGYKKIEKGIQSAAIALKSGYKLELRKTDGKIGSSQPKYQAFETAIGKRKFTDDLFVDGMLYAALKFTDYPRAKITKIDTDEALKVPGVYRIFTAKDIPGEKKVGLIVRDWHVMIEEGEMTNYVGDVIAGVVADTDENARIALDLIQVDYAVYEPITNVFKALEGERIHPDRPNNFETTRFNIGNADEVIARI